MSRNDIRTTLDITKKQLIRLSRSPAFPKPIMETKFEIVWGMADIMRLKRRMDTHAQCGRMVPECLYSWQDTGESELPLRK